MKRFRLNRFTGLMITIAAVAVAIGSYLFIDLYQTQKRSRHNYVRAVRGLDLIGELQYSAQEARRTLLYALSTSDSNLQVDYADQSRAAEAIVTKHLAEYQQLAVNAKEAGPVMKDWEAYLAVRDGIIAAMLEGDPKTAIALDLRDGVAAFNALKTDLENIKHALRTGAGQLLQELDDSFLRSLLRMAGILGILTMLGIVSAKTSQTQTLVGELRLTESRLREDFARAQHEERATAELFAAVLRAATEYSIIGTTPDGIINVFNPGAERLLGYRADEVVGRVSSLVLQDAGEVAQRAAELGMDAGFEVFAAAARRGAAETREWTYLRKDGSRFTVSLTVTAMRDAAGELTGFIGIATDLSEGKSAAAALEASQQKLIESSRLAGMAEVATGVLHNVGNVLNSVNVSGNVLNERLRGSKVAALAKVAAMINEHRTDFSDFVSTDPRGKRIPDLVSTISDALREEHDGLLAELSLITTNIGHIKEIVAMQQNYSRVGGLIEQLEVKDLVTDALRMLAVSLTRHKVNVTHEHEAVPKVQVDRHKVLQILVNILSNAKHAVDDSGREDKEVIIRIHGHGGNCVRISVQDNGIGIAPENLTKIFAHGFTTKKSGHGFGLHSCALAAIETGGALHVHSDGAGKGATFTLELPVVAPSGVALAN